MRAQEFNEHYRAKGWVVVEDIFTREDAERIAQLAAEFGQKEVSEVGPSITVDRSADGELAPRKVFQPFLKHEAFRRFVLDERLIRAVRGLLGDDPLLVLDQILFKPPRFGSAKPYHQDNWYFRCFPQDKVITAWIALDDVDVSNGCLRYIDGSHQGPILPHEPVPGEPHNLSPRQELIDLSKESLAPVRKGGVVFHHSHTLHTSHRNGSDRWRRGYATHWVTAEVRCEGDLFDSAYFRRPDYPQR